MPRPPFRAALPGLLALVLLLVACGESAPPAPVSTQAPPAETPEPTPDPSPEPGSVVAAPGSDSEIYEPNPAAIVVAVEAGHGGCLDWGVPNPFDNTVENAEKTMTLGIARELRDLLEAEGVTVVMVRDDDVALAGDDYPPLGCHGEPFRDVDGDGHAGFGPSVPEATRTRDELSARIDLVNMARADLLISIHINSMVQNDVVYEIAATETFFSDRTEWSDRSEALARHVQSHVVAGLDGKVGYDRQDRGAKPVDYYVIAPPPDAPGGLGPPRGLLMPGVLAEVGSMSLEAEGELLGTREGQLTVAESLLAAVTAYIAERPLAVRYDAELPGGQAGEMPEVTPGDGPLFWASSAPSAEPFGLRLTNSGHQTWPAGMRLLAGLAQTAEPYLAAAPADLEPFDVEIPQLTPGESVELSVELPSPSSDGRHIAWLTLATGDQSLAGLGSPPIQLALD
jgi:N-acetylmuramoyl-L-alanine amidase